MQLELNKFYKIPAPLRNKIIMKYRLADFDPNDLEQKARKARVVAALRDPEVVPYLRGSDDTDLPVPASPIEDSYELSDVNEVSPVVEPQPVTESVPEKDIHSWKMLLFDTQGRALFAADVVGECLERDDYLIFVQHGGSPCAIYDGVRVKFLSAEVNGPPNNLELAFVTSFAHAGTGKTKLTYLVFKKNGANSVRVDEHDARGRVDERDSTPVQTDNSI
jgi:hypothetical protein